MIIEVTGWVALPTLNHGTTLTFVSTKQMNQVMWEGKVSVGSVRHFIQEGRREGGFHGIITLDVVLDLTVQATRLCTRPHPPLHKVMALQLVTSGGQNLFKFVHLRISLYTSAGTEIWWISTKA